MTSLDITIGSWLAAAQRQLETASVPTARLDALVLLEDCLGLDRAHILAHPEQKVSTAHSRVLARQLARRARHEPLAYIRGKTEFYGREFYVDRHVLEPRPESETMIDLLKALAPPAGQIIVDIGTGSGALAITAACELDHAMVMATDIDPACLVVARRNAAAHNVDVQFYVGDLLAPVIGQIGKSQPPYALLCNLPYVPDDFQINLAAGHEPRLAIFGGADGLDLYRRLFEQISACEPEERPIYVLAESLPAQHEVLSKIAKQHGYDPCETQDFVIEFRHTNSV